MLLPDFDSALRAFIASFCVRSSLADPNIFKSSWAPPISTIFILLWSMIKKKWKRRINHINDVKKLSLVNSPAAGSCTINIRYSSLELMKKVIGFTSKYCSFEGKLHIHNQYKIGVQGKLQTLIATTYLNL